MKTNQFKKVYIEITNHCNLSCDFCIKNQRKPENISLEKLKVLLKKLKPYTKYLYFHILGEPLMHPNINELIDQASKDFQINITTNGYLLNRIKTNSNIRQVNISLHSFDPKYHISLQNYLNTVFESVDCLVKNNTYISLRLWTKNSYSKEIINYIQERYSCQIDLSNNNYKVHKNIYISKFHEFIWPDLQNQYYSEKGTCYGLRDHFGILVDGTVVPCCLDTIGAINLGNIYTENLNKILSNPRCQNMRKGFQNHQKIEEFCKHCSFLSDEKEKKS